MVIITGGIDLSVGSLIALSAVIATLVMKQLGGPAASAWVVLAGISRRHVGLWRRGRRRRLDRGAVQGRALHHDARRHDDGPRTGVPDHRRVLDLPGARRADLARARAVAGGSQHRDSAGGALRRSRTSSCPTRVWDATSTPSAATRRPLAFPACRCACVIVFVYMVSAPGRRPGRLYPGVADQHRHAQHGQSCTNCT